LTRTKIIGLLASLAAAGWVANDMIHRTSEQLLWGWRPFFLLILLWIAILLFADGNKENAQHRRWLILSSLSGLILSVGFPPSPMTPLMFIGFLPLLIMEQEIYDASGAIRKWRVFRYAFNGFLIWNMCTTWWVLNTSFMPGIVANVLNAIFMATVIMLYHHARHVLGKRLHWLILVSFWIGFEYLHIQWEISWPWLNLGHSFAQYPSWVQWYEYTGIFGGSMWILVTNYWIWTLYQKWSSTGRWSRKGMIAAMALILIPIAIGVLRYYTYPLSEGDTEIVVIQPNYEPHYAKFTTSQREQLVRFIALSDSAVTRTTEYLVFPETSFGYVNLSDLESDFRIEALRSLVDRHPGLKLVTGLASFRVHDRYVDLPAIRAQIQGDDTTYIDIQNSAIQIVTGEEIELYFKSKLVPGAEIFPYRDLLPFIAPLIKMLDGTTAGHTMQDEREVFSSTTANVAPIICYESIYGSYVGQYVRKGAGILFIVTNDGWWDDTPGHVQHLLIGALRAIEHRRPIARSANSGVSCFINERGDILQPTKYGEMTAIKGKLNASSDTITFYTRWGDVIARLSAFIAVMFLVLAIVNTVQIRLGLRN
jgi:apolipoprotein N-acyltransferase